MTVYGDTVVSCVFESELVPRLSYVVVTRLSVCGPDDTHTVTGLQLVELQQHHSQVVDEQLRVHKGHGKLDDTVVVFILRDPIQETLQIFIYLFFNRT